MGRSPIFDVLERRKKVGEIFRKILSSRGLPDDIFDERELQIRPQVIVEGIGNNNRLSNAILDFMFPRIRGATELLHYTTPDGLAGVARSGELRLYALRKRIDEAEIKTFAKKHGLEGYLFSAEGEPYYRELSDDLFYTSFTQHTQKDPGAMWNTFAKGGTGARLKFQLVPTAAEVRSIQYEQQSRTLLNELNAALGEAPFLPSAISKIGAFYLPSSLDVESEVRLLVKRYKDAQVVTASDGMYEYLPIPIGKPNPFCKLEVLEIVPGPNSDAAIVKAAIAHTVLDKVFIGAP